MDILDDMGVSFFFLKWTTPLKNFQPEVNLYQKFVSSHPIFYTTLVIAVVSHIGLELIIQLNVTVKFLFYFLYRHRYRLAHVANPVWVLVYSK